MVYQKNNDENGRILDYLILYINGFQIISMS